MVAVSALVIALLSSTDTTPDAGSELEGLQQRVAALEAQLAGTPQPPLSRCFP